MTRLFSFATVMGLFLVVIACGSPRHVSGPELPRRQGEPSLKALLAKPESITFKHVQQLVLEPSCIQCHGVEKFKAGVRLDSLAALRGEGGRSSLVPFDPEASLIYQTLILASGPRMMPPADKPPLAEEQKRLVYEWIANGGKEIEGENAPKPKTLSEELAPYFADPKTIDYAVVSKHVFETSCTKCHSVNGAQPDEEAINYGQDMTDYNAVMSNDGIVKSRLVDTLVPVPNAPRVIKGSRIYRSVAITQTMPPAKQGYLPLDGLRVKLLRLWILNCAIKSYGEIAEDRLLEEPEESGKVRDCQAM